MEELVALLSRKQLTLASCESLTGGLFASQVVDVSGASKVFLGALVTYAPQIKERVAQVQAAAIAQYGVVSEEVARQMACHTARIMGSDLAVSFTGNAGPQPSEGKPVGLVYSAIAYQTQCLVFEDHLQGDRIAIRQQLVQLMETRITDFVLALGIEDKKE